MSYGTHSQRPMLSHPNWALHEVMVNLIHMPCVNSVPGSHETSMNALQIKKHALYGE